MFGPLLDVQMSFRVARDCAPCQEGAKHEGFVACPKTMAGVGPLKRICKFIRDVMRSGHWFPERVAFWSIRSSGLVRWFCVTGAALVWPGITFSWTDGMEKSQNALARGRQLCIQLSTVEGSLAELLRFWCCQLQTLRNSPRIASLVTLSSAKIEEVSQNCFDFKLAERQIDR